MTGRWDDVRRVAGGSEAVDHGDVPGSPSDPAEPAAGGDAGTDHPGDVLEGGMRPLVWQRRWAALPRAGRLLVVALVVVVAAALGGIWLRDRAVERALAERVDLTASMGVWSSSTAPPRGRVSYFVVVGNEGALPVRVTSVEGSGSGLRFRTTDDLERRVGTDDEEVFPLSVRLTCARRTDAGELTAQVAVRRADGASVTREVRVGSAEQLLHVATTLCATRPDLEDAELSGPV